MREYLAYHCDDETDLTCGARVRLLKGEGRTVKGGGAFVYDNEIDTVTGDYENGAIVTVEDFDGYVMGRGMINDLSKIRVRMLTRRKDQQVTAAFLMERVRAAWEYRKRVIDTDSCRVVFGEADFLPGLTVDKYGNVLVAEVLSLGMERLKPLVLSALVQVLAEDGCMVRGIYERSDAAVRTREGMEPFKGFLTEPFDTKVPIEENGVRYIVDIANGQKTGFFLDQKLNRRLIQPICRGMEVLDCFTHTGSFALNAAVAGARKVTAIDASETAIAQAKENALLNAERIPQDCLSFVCSDVFAYLPKQEEAGVSYDVVILDPPAFTKSKSTVQSASRGYREINRRGMQLVRDGGYLATCTCSHFMEEEHFKRVIEAAARDAHRRLKQVAFRTQAPDHPILWAQDTSYYLKFYVFQVLKEK
ncbi:MAG: class I SAM-dependent rRNA methyltransferase [Lachnospiraceae bacterium]|nr:class I SAM-dependent rRNA methyltransferase [Lachnospiraceae bacterium]